MFQIYIYYKNKTFYEITDKILSVSLFISFDFIAIYSTLGFNILTPASILL